MTRRIRNFLNQTINNVGIAFHKVKIAKLVVTIANPKITRRCFNNVDSLKGVCILFLLNLNKVR